MKIRQIPLAACALALLCAGEASAAPVPPRPAGVEAPLQEAALLRSGTPAGRAKQRYLTRKRRCIKVPSRC